MLALLEPHSRHGRNDAYAVAAARIDRYAPLGAWCHKLRAEFPSETTNIVSGAGFVSCATGLFQAQHFARCSKPFSRERRAAEYDSGGQQEAPRAHFESDSRSSFRASVWNLLSQR